MPWSNQSGGGGGNGPWGGPPKNPGPWGSGPQGGGSGGGGGQRPPDLEDLFRRSQDKLRDLFPGAGGGRIGGRGIALLVLGVLAVWGFTGFYTIRPNEVGLELVFGRYVGTTTPGLRYNWPAPIGSVIKPTVTEVKTMEIGVRSPAEQRRGPRSTVDEALMLTGDENIVDIDFAVQWQISPTTPQDYVFNLRAQEATIRAVAEAVMREVIGKRTIQPILTTDRQAIEGEVRQQMQDVLDSYKAGVVIRLVQLLKADPPSEVIDAFRDVQAARQDQDRAKNEADTYAANIVPVARGDAQRVIQEAEAYKSQTVAEARGAASRFDQIYAEYKLAPVVTRERMFFETMERVFGRMDKIIIDQKGGGGGVVPYLPLNELMRPAPSQPPRPTGPNIGRLQGTSQ